MTKVNFEGREWDVDTAHVGLKHALVIQAKTGMALAEWERSLLLRREADKDHADPPAEWLMSMAALYWLMRAQSGQPVDFDECDFDVWGFFVAYATGLEREIAARREELARRQEQAVELVPFGQSAPPYREPPTPPATTQLPLAPAWAGTGYSPPGTSSG